MKMVMGVVGGTGRECYRLREHYVQKTSGGRLCKVKLTGRGHCGWRKRRPHVMGGHHRDEAQT